MAVGDTPKGDGRTDTAAGTPYTLTDCGTVTLGRAAYRVERQTYHATGGETVWLHGPNGAVYHLRGFLGADDGERQVISWKSGRELRAQGNEIRVICIGDVIEVKGRPPRGPH